MSPTQIHEDHVPPFLLIPDYDPEIMIYPGDLKPGSYTRDQFLDLLRTHSDNPEAIVFLADMLE